MAEKKKSSSKEPVKKNKKVPKKTEKVVLKKKEVVVSEKKDWKNFFQSTPFLIGVMIGLVILIIFLGFCIHQKEEKKKAEFDAHITIPVLKEAANFEFGVDASLLLLEDNQEYIFKITNFRKEEKATVELPYQIVIENDTNSIISLTKEDSDEDLIQEQKQTILEEVMPLSEEDEEVYYHLKITSHKKLKKDEFIRIQILT